MDDLINVEEIETFRIPKDFIQWFEKYLEKTRLNKQKYKKRIILREGIAKEVYEEVFPLYRFLHLFGYNWPTSKFRNRIGSQNYDVEIKSTTNVPFHYIEITVSDMDYEEHLRWLSFLENKSVSAIGKVTYSGNKRTGLDINVANEALSYTAIIDEKKTGIKEAIKLKSEKDYPSQIALLTYFDDNVIFTNEKYSKDMLLFVDSLENDWESKFTEIYIVGASGHHGWKKTIGEPALHITLSNLNKTQSQQFVPKS